jgi:hypothetical protein
VAILDNDTIRVTPFLDGSGTGSFNLRVQDGREGVTFIEFNVMIEAVNDPPEFIAPVDWTYEIELGGTKTIDLRYVPYFTEDVDHTLNELQAVTDYPLTDINGLVINISIPADSASDNVSILVWVKDPLDAISEIRELKIRIVEEIVNGGGFVEVDNITFSNENGDVSVSVDGKEGQTIWVVFTEFNGQVRGSYVMTESEDMPGHYEFELEDPPWTEGEVLYLHLSGTKNGPNESGDLPLTFTYDKGEDDDGPNDMDPNPYLIGFASILIILGLLFIFIIVKNRKRPVSDFDYDSLLEE